MHIELDKNRPVGVTTLMSVGALDGFLLDSGIAGALTAGSFTFVLGTLFDWKNKNKLLISLGVAGLFLSASQW